MEQRRVDRDRAWSNFWRHGALHSLQGSFAGNYAGEIRHFWNTVFRDVDGTQRVLDCAQEMVQYRPCSASVRNPESHG